jgi:hypothetical protein
MAAQIAKVPSKASYGLFNQSQSSVSRPPKQFGGTGPAKKSLSWPTGVRSPRTVDSKC